MSGPGPFSAPGDTYKQAGPFTHSGYPSGDAQMTTPYSPAGHPFQRESSYPSGEPTAAPPPYSEAGDLKPYSPGGSSYPPGNSGYLPSTQGYPPNSTGYPPTSPKYPSSGPGYPTGGGSASTGFSPGGGALVPPRPPPPMSCPSDPYETTTSDDKQRIIIVDSEGQDGWAGNSLSDKTIRHTFIRKVYLILTCQLLVTFAFVAVFIFYEPIKLWVQINDWFYSVSYAVFIATYMVLVCCNSVRRRWPINLICLTIFTLALSYMTGTISSFYDTNIVLISVAITAGVCLAISLFAIQTKIDFTLCSGLLFVLVVILILFTKACIIAYLVSGPDDILNCVFGAVGAAIFSVFLVFDTQMVVGGKHRHYQLSPEEYIYGALELYVDIVNMFLFLLRLIRK